MVLPEYTPVAPRASAAAPKKVGAALDGEYGRSLPFFVAIVSTDRKGDRPTTRPVAPKLLGDSR